MTGASLRATNYYLVEWSLFDCLKYLTLLCHSKQFSTYLFLFRVKHSLGQKVVNKSLYISKGKYLTEQITDDFLSFYHTHSCIGND